MKSLWKVSVFTVIVAIAVPAVANADMITGTMVSPTLNAAGVYNISRGTTDWVYFDASASNKITKDGGPGSFSGVNGAFSRGGDSQICVTYSGGTPNASSTDCREFSWNTTVGFTHTLLADSENLSVYLVGWDTRADISASLGKSGTLYSVTGVVLPATINGNGTGQKNTYGILNLAVSGTTGDTLTFSVAVNETGVTDGHGNPITDGNIGLQAASVTVPEPATSTISLSAALVAFLAYAWRKRK